MKAIVYESNSGHTKAYAELLSKKTGLPAYDHTAAKASLRKDDEIFFMGWLMAGGLKGYKKAANRYTVKGIAAVGMAFPADKFIKELIEKYKISDTKVFYLQGGFDMNKLHGVYKFMMKSMSKAVGSSLAKKENKTAEDIATLQMMQEGRSYVSEDNLAPILEWINKK